MLHIPGLYIAHSEKKGRAVYTSQEVAIGDLIEIAYPILLPADQAMFIDQTDLYPYYFIWPDSSARICIGLGYVSLYNHSKYPNAAITFDLTDETILVHCIQPIAAGDEICIDYLNDEKGNTPQWFDPIKE